MKLIFLVLIVAVGLSSGGKPKRSIIALTTTGYLLRHGIFHPFHTARKLIRSLKGYDIVHGRDTLSHLEVIGARTVLQTAAKLAAAQAALSRHPGVTLVNQPQVHGLNGLQNVAYHQAPGIAAPVVLANPGWGSPVIAQVNPHSHHSAHSLLSALSLLQRTHHR